MEIILLNGESREIQIDKFKAMDGWNIQRDYLEFAATSDKQYRRNYTMEVLSYAKVVLDDRTLPLSTDALIDNHLQTWTNVEAVFEAVLAANGIDARTHADKPGYWEKAGGEMAVAFIAEVTRIMGPAFKLAQGE